MRRARRRLHPLVISTGAARQRGPQLVISTGASRQGGGAEKPPRHPSTPSCPDSFRASPAVGCLAGVVDGRNKSGHDEEGSGGGEISPLRASRSGRNDELEGRAAPAFAGRAPPGRPPFRHGRRRPAIHAFLFWAPEKTRGWSAFADHDAGRTRRRPPSNSSFRPEPRVSAAPNSSFRPEPPVREAERRNLPATPPHRHARPCSGHLRRSGASRASWMAGTSPAMTKGGAAAARFLRFALRAPVEMTRWKEGRPPPSRGQARPTVPPFVMVGGGRPSTLFCFGRPKKLVDGRPSPTMTRGERGGAHPHSRHFDRSRASARPPTRHFDRSLPSGRRSGETSPPPLHTVMPGPVPGISGGRVPRGRRGWPEQVRP